MNLSTSNPNDTTDPVPILERTDAHLEGLRRHLLAAGHLAEASAVLTDQQAIRAALKATRRLRDRLP